MKVLTAIFPPFLVCACVSLFVYTLSHPITLYHHHTLPPMHLQVLLVGLYLLLCVLYWAWSALQLAAELRDVLDVKHFINNKLGISDRQVNWFGLVWFALGAH